LSRDEKLLVINVLANSIPAGGPMSGGDRIWIECAKRWMRDQTVEVRVLTTVEGVERGHDYGLTSIPYIIWSRSGSKGSNVYMLYFMRALQGIVSSLRYPNSSERNVVIYSSSDFIPDSIPALIMKLRFKNAKWIAGFYLFVAKPLSKESPYKGRLFFRSLFYYLSQMPIYWLIQKRADMVWVTNDLDRYKFINGSRLTADQVVAVRGGVDTKTPASIPEPDEKRYDAVFIGRFHPQKGVLELIDIWRFVCDKRKDAQLAMIGTGELEAEVKAKILKCGLEKNVTLLGFKDGLEKLKIFKNSKIVVHPATYDSGGMASAEAMACGIPGVSFDLPALKTYYPSGMLKSPCYDLQGFAENIIKLLEDQNLYTSTQREALKLAERWDWDIRAQELLEVIKKCF